MHWISIILIGIAANLDNLGIGLAYGVKRVKIPVLSNAVIAIMSMIVTFVAVTAGGRLLNIYPLISQICWGVYCFVRLDCGH